MTEELMAEMNINKILVAILESVGPVRVPTLTLLDAANNDKELVLTYDEQEPPSFIISIKDKDGTASN